MTDSELLGDLKATARVVEASECQGGRCGPVWRGDTPQPNGFAQCVRHRGERLLRPKDRIHHDAICPECGGYASIVVVLARAWCVHPLANGGCGGHWSLRRDRWRLLYTNAEGYLG